MPAMIGPILVPQGPARNPMTLDPDLTRRTTTPAVSTGGAGAVA
ncbi:hypothetical protein [Pararhizobium mangrovi]|nr:hypothetical protein [Pararhizobium mangrovi]